MKVTILQGRLRLTPETVADRDSLAALGRVARVAVETAGKSVDVVFSPIASPWAPMDTPPSDGYVVLFKASIPKFSAAEGFRPDVFAGKWPDQADWGPSNPSHWLPIPPWPSLPGPLPADGVSEDHATAKGES